VPQNCENLKELLKGSERLPTLPVVALKILEVARRDDVTVGEMERVISQDPPLAAKVLRIINSPFYSLPRKVTSVRQAISLLGVNSVKNLALGFSLVKGAGGKPSGFDYLGFWKRSIFAAVAGNLLAKAVPGVSCEDCFFLGLLQDIGVLALNHVAPERYEEVLRLKRAEGCRLAEAERQVLGMDHAEAGSYLIETWGLPPAFFVSIRFHHAPDASDNPALLPLTRLLAAASSIAEFFAHERPLEAMEAIGAMAKRQGLEGAIDKLMIQVFSEAVSIGAIFDMDMRHQKSYTQIIEEAQAELDKNSQAMQERIVMQAQECEHLKDQAIRDGLTGLHNHRFFHEVLEQELDRALRYHRPLALVLGDIDKFKEVNDTFGHQMGDQVLKEISGMFQQTLRKSDFVARYGGEEFAVLLVETSLENAIPMAERLREKIEGLKAAQGGREAQVTMSFGVTAVGDQPCAVSPEDFIRLADEALYEAKRTGRNRCCVRQPTPHRVAQGDPLSGPACRP